MVERGSGPGGGPGAGRVEEYLDHVGSHDLGAARALALSGLASGADLVRVIEELLVPAMAEVGARWYDGRWNAAQEHVASGITENVLSAATVRARTRRRPAGAPTAVMACPGGEAHVLPARFAAELLVESGVDVIVLGLPVPVRDLAAFLTESRPCALILSCTEPLALPGARDAIAAAHRVGVPVLVGGAGFGPDGRWGRAVGADAWARRPDEATAPLRAWRDESPAFAELGPVDAEVAALHRLRDSFVDHVLHTLVYRVPAVGRYGGQQVQRAHSDVKLVIAALSSALLVKDDRLFTERVAWTRGLPETRRARAIVLDESLTVIAEELGHGFPGAHRMLAAVVSHA